MGNLFSFLIFRIIVFLAVKSLLNLKEKKHKIIALVGVLFSPGFSIFVVVILKFAYGKDSNLNNTKNKLDKEKNSIYNIPNKDLEEVHIDEGLVEESYNNEYSYSGNSNISSESFRESDNVCIDKNEEYTLEEGIEKDISKEELEDSKDLNLLLANNFESLIKNKKINSYFEPLLNDSNANLLIKGRYESGKDREFISRILMSRVDFLNSIEDKFKNMDIEKLKREFEIFNEFDAELESIRRTEILKLNCR